MTVEEYLEDELADNSDDEKQMQKAEYRVGRKVKAAAANNSKRKAGSIWSHKCSCCSKPTTARAVF